MRTIWIAMVQRAPGRRGSACRGYAVGALLSWVAFATSSPVRAEPDEGIRFAYERGAGAGDCPEAAAVRASIARLSGSDPFDDEGARVLECALSRDADGLAANVALRSPDGTILGRRTLRSVHGDCRELTSELTLVVAMALARREPWLLGEDPGDEPGDAPASETGDETDGEPHEDLGDEPTEGAENEASLRSATALDATTGVRAAAAPHRPPALVEFAHAGLAALANTNSHLGGSLRVGAGLRRGNKALELELRLDSADKIRIAAGGSVSTWSGGLALVPCGHFGSVSACALVSAGFLRGRGRDLAINRSATTPWLAAGGRLAWHVPVAARVGIRVFADVEGSLSETTFIVDSEPVWTSPAVAFALGCAALGYFP